MFFINMPIQIIWFIINISIYVYNIYYGKWLRKETDKFEEFITNQVKEKFEETTEVLKNTLTLIEVSQIHDILKTLRSTKQLTKEEGKVLLSKLEVVNSQIVHEINNNIQGYMKE